MCRISYQRCVCFVFLVILAVLSCSGFRIDNLAMTDIISRKNVRGGVALDDLRHRVRHQRPPPPPPDRPLLRPQRSSQGRRPKHQGPCSEPDVSWKAYRAAVVVVARAESRSAKCKDNCTVFFKVVETLKNSSYPVDERIRLRFSSAAAAAATPHGCDYDARHHLLRTRIDQAKEYILFLDTDGAHNFNAVFLPQMRRNKSVAAVRRVLSPNFRPRSVRLDPHIIDKPPYKLLKLMCKVKGFPIPIIYWKRNNSTLLPQNSRYRIRHKRRKSTLTIQNPSEADSNSFQCVVRGVDGKETSHTFRTSKSQNATFPTISDREPCSQQMAEMFCYNGGRCSYLRSMNEHMCECSSGFTGERCGERIASDQSREPCPEDMNKDYCFNGGKCFYVTSMTEFMCECPDGFTGNQCAEKSSDQSSRYRQTPIYTCNIGLYTKHDNC